MKILFCLNHFLPDYVAGTEVYTFNLAKYLKAGDTDAVVLIPNLGSVVTEEYLYEDIKVIKYAENSIEDRNMIMGKTKPDGVEAFIQIIKNEQPDIVHFHELAPGRGINIFHVEAAWLLKKKIVLTCHVANYSCNTGNLKYKDTSYCDGKIEIMKCTACSYHARGIDDTKATMIKAAAGLVYSAGIDTTNWNNSLGTALGFPFMIATKRKDLLRLADMVDKIVVLTKWYKKILEINGVSPSRLCYISQGLPGEGAKAKTSFGNVELPLKLVFIGRISYLKGVHLLLNALQQLPDNTICLDIYGPDREDEYAVNCRQLATQMNNVNWMGSIDSNKVIEMLSGYDLLCLPSTFSEMSPLVIQEAFAAGIPVLASNVYGNAEQIEDGVNGWLFEFKCSVSLKKKLEMLIQEPRLIDEAKKNIPEVKSFEEVAIQYAELYAKMIKPQRD